MAAAFVALLPAAGRRGLIAGPQSGAEVGDLERFVVGHPLPDKGSVRAGRRALEFARDVDDTAPLVVLLSGGASAGLAVPLVGISLADKATTTATLLDAGVTIDGLNCVRKHLSAIKGGRLAQASGGRVVTLAISDVVDPVPDDPAVIGSGPTSPDPTSYGDALKICDSEGARVPASVHRLLERGHRGELPETPLPGDPRLAASTFRIIGSRVDALCGARREAERRGFDVVTIDTPVTGEARVAGPRYVRDVARLSFEMRRPACVLSAGETTVRVVGSGRGGRNQELALSAVPLLRRRFETAVVASVGTDGVDGPTDAAGALADTTTLQRASARGLNPPDRYLDTNDAWSFFDPLGDLIRTGPTETNVGDLQVMVIA